MADRDNASADWGRVFSEAVMMLRAFTGSDAEAVAGEAMVLVFAGKAPTRRAGESLGGHVARVGLHAWRIKQRMDRRHRRRGLLGTLLGLRDVARWPPDDPAANVLDEQGKARLFEALFGLLASDDEARGVVLRVQEGVNDVKRQAEELGVSGDVLRDARRRIKGQMDAVMAREGQRAASVVKPGRAGEVSRP